MKVKLNQKWFIRDIPYDSYGRVFVGRLYRRGVHDLPDEMYDVLPKKKDGKLVDWIEVLDKNFVEKEELQPNTLSEMSKEGYERDPVRKKLEVAETNFRKKA